MRVRRIRTGLLVLACALLVLVTANCGTIRAGKLLQDALDPPADMGGRVVETRETATTSAGNVWLRVIRPADASGPLPAILLVHGAHEDGYDSPQLVAMGRAIAVRGATAALVDLESLRTFGMDADDPERVLGAAAWLASRTDLAEDGRVALFGISVGGAYSLIAAQDPRLADRVSCVLAFGAYPDVEDLLLGWLVTPRPDAPGMLDPLTVGRRRVLLGNVARLVPERDRGSLAAALEDLLDGRRDAAPAGAAPEAQLVWDVAASESAIPEETARRLLAPLAPQMQALSPVRRTAVPRAPVFLLQGQGDPIVTAADAERLRAALDARGADVELHVTDLFVHVDTGADGTPSFFDAWPLLRFLARALDAAGM
jgi:dienelactone hydrolase